MSTSLTAACEWRSGAVCQFPGLQHTVAQFDGRNLCRAHAPSDASGKTYEWMREYVMTQSRSGTVDFSGCVFPAAPAGGLADYPLPAHSNVCTVCSDCRFEGNVHISGASQEMDFSGSYFAGTLFVAGFARALTCDAATLEGGVQVVIAAQGTAVHLRRCSFASGVTLGGLEYCSRLIFDGARLGAVPVLQGDRIPQQTTFTRARFLPGTLAPENEGAFRRIRNQFAANRARELEGVFYRYEKICHRRSLPWPSKWFARVLSYTYDLTAQYGQSYERALLAFIAIQICFGVGYSIAANRFGVPGQFDGTMAVFTLSQVVKPFELFSARESLSPAYQATVGSNPSPWWAFFGLAHSVISITLVALFILAVRWRFRRE